MTKWIRAAALAAAAVAVQGCGMSRDGDPVAAAQGLLSAVQTGDTKAFEAQLDRPALRADLRQQIASLGRAEGVDLGGPSDPALDRMIDPQNLHVVQADGGAPLAAPPSKAQVAPLMKHLDGRRACLHDLTPDQRCLLTFAREPAGWRLVGMPAAELRIAVPAAPARKDG
ncbi:MAG TPA: DUF2939 domain-containing protein [Phenylobacterium sp.]|jgi:hypothetical protein|nr:DUF2939 domain-containing protein [Phenylobacterium sp.]